MFRAILFDMDGVLVDSYLVWFHLLRDVARRLGYPDISPEAFHAAWGQGVAADVRVFYPDHTESQIEAAYAAHYDAHARHHRIDPDARSVFTALRRVGRSIAVITNTPTQIAGPVLDRAGLTPDLLVGGTDVPQGKPAPDMVLRAPAHFCVPAGEAVVVGDTDNDRRAAAAAGVRFLGLRIDGDDRVEELSEVVDRVS